MKDSLIIKNLHVSVSGKEVIKGLNLTIARGEVHAVMGPNGSGKSTLAYAISGHPNYEIRNQKSEIRINKKNIINLEPEERAKLGLFLAFQNPITIPGVRVSQFLKAAYQSINGNSKISPIEFYRILEKKASSLGINKSFLERSINDGFSGGEKKKMEMLQLLTLQPSFIVIDEIDTGLDIDALKIVANTLNSFKNSKNRPGVLIISHYQRIFNYIKPDFVHILKKGKIIKTGGCKLVERVEKEGYARLTN